MKRFLTIGIAVAAFTAVFAASLKFAPRLTSRGVGQSQAAAQVQRGAPESMELAAPEISPDVIAPDVPTIVTFTTVVTDPSIRRLKLQFFDPAKQKWKTLGKLRDDGLFGDQTAGDGTFTVQVQILESSGRARLTLLGKRAREKGNVPSPAQFRLMAKKSGQHGRVVSPAVLTDRDIGVIITYPSDLVARPDANNDPSHILIQSTTDDIVLGGVLPQDTAVPYVTDGYRIAIWSTTYTPPFDINNWLSSTYPNSEVGSVSTIAVSGTQSYRVTFRDEIGAGEPITIVPLETEVVSIAYSSTFGSDSSDEASGLQAYDRIIQSLQLIP